jgi:hypothetical protein
MRPFRVTESHPGKAIPKRFNERQLSKFEKDGERRIVAAFQKLRRDLFRGIGKDDVNMIPSRMNDPAIIGPFRDTMNELLRTWALEGADYGRQTIEREVLGVS